MADKKTQDIGHCKTCKGQWVIKEGTKGLKYSYIDGRRCPYCGSNDLRYTKESNR